MISTIIAVLVGLVLGLAVLVYVRNARRERRMAAELALIDAAAGSAATASTTTTTTGLAPRGALDAGAIVINLDEPVGADAASMPSEVRLQLPQGARLYVDGRQLPAGTESIPRPDAGIVTVLVKADAHQDALVEIAPTSPDEIEVTMVEKEKPKPKPKHVSPPDPAATIAMPPNPYE